MLSFILAISALIGLHETVAQHAELTKESTRGCAAIMNASLYGSFAALFWPVGIAFYLCARYGRQKTSPLARDALISRPV